MKCPACNNEEIDFMWGFAVTNPWQENEIVCRHWYCEECKNGGDVEYQVKEIKILHKNGKRLDR